MSDRKNHLCPVGLAGALDNRIRRWVHNPREILRPYVKEGMTVLDVGCGPGFFTIDIAHMVGKSGRVIAADLQEEMLDIVRDKIQGTELEERVALHKCEEEKMGVTEPVDFAVVFFTAHEIPDKEGLFNEIRSVLRPSGEILLVEPPVHVSKRAFEEIVSKGRNTGFTVLERPKVLFCKAVILRKT